MRPPEAQAGPHLGATYGYMGAADPGSFHGTAFATVCNGYDEAKRKQFRGPSWRPGSVSTALRWSRLGPSQAGGRTACRRLRDCQGLRCAEECAEGVDAVLIVDDGSGEQWKYAQRAASQRRAHVLRQAAGDDGQAGQGGEAIWRGRRARR